MPNTPPYSAITASPLGNIGIIISSGKLSLLEMLPETTTAKSPHDDMSKMVVSEIKKYFANPCHSFSLDFHFDGTEFQQKVWRALQDIPSGETWTYGKLAKILKTGPRAIGQACRTNPIPIIIPCHRIIAANHLGGYAGATEGKKMGIKKWLLQHEGCLPKT
jgi:methylated-DNA-[protein]-cysteine S-methyltransferase